MKLSKERKERITEILFGLSDASTNSRNIWRVVLMFSVCMALSVIGMGITIFGGVEDSRS